MKGGLTGLREACGLCAVSGGRAALRLAVQGVRALQHRGQDCWGAVWSEGGLQQYTAPGLIPDIWRTQLPDSTGGAAIAHVRYATSGGPHSSLAQPVLVHGTRGMLALAHNGNLTNNGELAARLGVAQQELPSLSDSGLAARLIAASPAATLLEAVAEAGRILRGAFSLLVQEGDEVIALRDPHGFRPLAVGRIPGGFIAASESGAIAAAGGSWLRSLVPGEVIRLHNRGFESFFPWQKRQGAQCAMELVYFASRDGMVFGEQVARFRRLCGRVLAQCAPAEADLVVGVPATGLDAAAGFAEESGVPLQPVLHRSAGSVRSFIEPTRCRREQQAAGKYTLDAAAVNGKRLVVVDDSLVRGTTLRSLTGRLYRAGAKAVHWRIASPPVVHPCYYGTDFPVRDELWSANGRLNEADSLEFLGGEPFARLLERPAGLEYCTACFDGAYPSGTGVEPFDS